MYNEIDPYSSAAIKSRDALDNNHYFSDIIDNNTNSAAKWSIRGGDGVYRSLYQIKGTLRGAPGIFEWMVETNGILTHRVFIPNGKITGIPNK